MANLNAADVYNQNRLGEKGKDLLISMGVTYIKSLVSVFNQNSKSDLYITFDELVDSIKNYQKLKKGDWIKADIIGLGFYEVVSIDEFHVNVKCLRIFEGKNPSYKDHVTCCHKGTDKETGKRIKIDQKKWFNRKVNRLKQK